eukprot:g32610.t1
MKAAESSETLRKMYFAPGTLVLELPLDNGGTLQVTSHRYQKEWRCLRFLSSGGLIQSVTKVVVSPNETLAKMRGYVVPLAYTKSFATVVLAALSAIGAPPLRFLCIGLGGGSVPTFFAESLPHCQVDVVELEPTVIHAAKQGMGFAERSNMRVILEDGATFAQRAVREQAPCHTPGNKTVFVCPSPIEADDAQEKGIYDAVLVDAYDPVGNVPAPLWRRREGLAEALAAGLLRPRGVVATNFLPHVDLAAPLEAYGDALASRDTGISFSIQAAGYELTN